MIAIVTVLVIELHGRRCDVEVKLFAVRAEAGKTLRLHRRNTVADVVEFLIDITGGDSRAHAACIFHGWDAIAEIVIEYRPRIARAGIAVAAIVAIFAALIVAITALILVSLLTLAIVALLRLLLRRMRLRAVICGATVDTIGSNTARLPFAAIAIAAAPAAAASAAFLRFLTSLTLFSRRRRLCRRTYRLLRHGPAARLETLDHRLFNRTFQQFFNFAQQRRFFRRHQ